jgi:hypothetical protein
MAFIFIDTLASTLQQLDAAQEKVTLISQPELIGAYGVGYFAAIQQKVRPRYPHLQIKLGIWCHAEPALVFAALDYKVDQIYFDAASDLWPKIQSLCAQSNLTLYPLFEVMHAMAPQ